MLKEFFAKIKRGNLSFAFSSVLSGITVGTIIFLFRSVAGLAVDFFKSVYSFGAESLFKGAAVFVFIIALSFGAYYIMKIAPLSKGGGIPFSIALSSSNFKFNWLLTLVATFMSSLISFVAGVPLGTEGPSVQMGALCSFGWLKRFKKQEEEGAGCVIKAGAGAGFAAATGAAISGFIFSLEEMNGKIKPRQLTASFLAVISAYGASSVLYRIFGLDFALFHGIKLEALPFKMYFIPLVAGVICGLGAVAFTKAAVGLRKVRSTLKIPLLVQVMVVFATTFIAVALMRDTGASGHDLIEKFLEHSGVWYILLILISLRVALLIFSNSVGVTGGLFVPILALGALLGALIISLFTLAGFDFGGYAVYFVLTAMAAFIAAANKMPITITVFTAELFCGFENALPVLIASLVSYGVFRLFCKKDLNEEVCEEFHKDNKNPERS